LRLTLSTLHRAKIVIGDLDMKGAEQTRQEIEGGGGCVFNLINNLLLADPDNVMTATL
jgi:hypothetical protein